MRLKPDFLARSIVDIDPAFLKTINAQNVLVDLDNTLVPRKSMEIDPAIKDWVDRVKKAGLNIYIVSNSLNKRATDLARSLKIENYLAPAGKPFLTGVKNFLQKYGISPETSVFIGDQLFTDIYLSQRLGLHTRILRKIELLLLLKWLREKSIKIIGED